MLLLFKFGGYESVSGSDANTLAEMIFSFVGRIENVELVGITTDAPSVMVGKYNGVGERLCEKFGRFIRHDMCEHHALASVLRVLDSIWPAQMNVPSVTQFCYLAWYIMNYDWERVRGLMVTHLKKEEEDLDDDVIEMLKGLRSVYQKHDVTEVAEKLLESSELNKPDKPNANRWNTVADCLSYVRSYWPILSVAFDDIRCYGGAAPGTGSIESMCGQWLKWSGSPKLHALLLMASEYVDVWRVHADRMDYGDELRESAKTYHLVYSRPERAFSCYKAFSLCKDKFRKLSSYAVMTDTFEGDEVDFLYLQLYSMGLSSVERNCGRYWTGVYLMGGFGDYYFADIVFEALSWERNSPKKPRERTPDGELLQTLYGKEELTHLHQLEVRKIMTKRSFNFAASLAELAKVKSRANEQQFLDLLDTDDSELAVYLRSIRPVLSSTQPVEKLFLDFDQQTSRGGKKAKNSVPTGGSASLDLIAAKVSISKHYHDIDKMVLDKSGKKIGRSRAKEDVAKSIEQTVRSLQATEEELKAGREHAKRMRDPFVTPRGGVCPHLEGLIRGWDAEYNGANFRHVAKSMASLRADGVGLDISLKCVCFPSELCKRASKRGAPGSIVTCETCLQIFHYKCVAEAGLVQAGLQKNARPRNFQCPGCK